MTQQQSESQTAATLAVVEAFNEAFNRHDVAAIMRAMTDDCVFEGPGQLPTASASRGKRRCALYGKGCSVRHPRPISRPKTYSLTETGALDVGSTPGWTGTEIQGG